MKDASPQRSSLAVELPRALADVVAARLRQAIVDGEFALGERISEEALAESFGVSRTPVRDALTQLQTAGLVEILPRRGSFVFRPAQQDVQAICDFRVMLEVQAARRGHAADGPGFIRTLQQLCDRMHQAAAQDDDVTYNRTDSRFHEAFFDYAGNSYLREAYGLVTGRISALRTAMSRQFFDARDKSLDEHDQAVHHIVRGDFAALQSLLAEHIGRTVEAFRHAEASGHFKAPARRSA